MIEFSLQDKVVLITGAGRAPAPNLALAFARQGAILAVNDLSPILLDPLAEAVRTQDGRIQTYVADATRGMPLRAMLDEVLNDWGKIDILVNNPRVCPEAPILSMDEWDWQRTIEMNLNGPFMISQLVARQMQELGQGVILNLVDTHSKILETPGRAAYAASQQGLLALSQAAARELIAYNIRVYTLCPDEALLYRSDPLFSDEIDTKWTDLALSLCHPDTAYLPGHITHLAQTQTGHQSSAYEIDPSQQE